MLQERGSAQSALPTAIVALIKSQVIVYLDVSNKSPSCFQQWLEGSLIE